MKVDLIFKFNRSKEIDCKTYANLFKLTQRGPFFMLFSESSIVFFLMFRIRKKKEKKEREVSQK